MIEQSRLCPCLLQLPLPSLASAPASLVHGSLSAEATMELTPMPLVAPPSHRRSSPTPIVRPHPPIAPPYHRSVLSSAWPLDTPCSAPASAMLRPTVYSLALSCTVVEMAMGARHGCRDSSTRWLRCAILLLIEHSKTN
jgi:hypothetical protein